MTPPVQMPQPAMSGGPVPGVPDSMQPMPNQSPNPQGMMGATPYSNDHSTPQRWESLAMGGPRGLLNTMVGQANGQGMDPQSAQRMQMLQGMGQMGQGLLGGHPKPMPPGNVNPPQGPGGGSNKAAQMQQIMQILAMAAG